MKDVPLTVIAVFKAKPGKENELKKILTGFIAPTRAEEGCLNYDLHVDQTDPCRLVFHENWTHKEALDAHLASDHLKVLKELESELLVSPVELILCRRTE